MKNEKLTLTLGKILALVAAAVVFGCAPPPPSTAAKATNREAALVAAGATTIGSAGASNGSWHCPSEPNILLKDNIGLNGQWDYTGADDYTVCWPATGLTGAKTFEVKGSTASRALCLYPMNAGPTGTPSLVATPQCFAVTGSPIFPNFSDATSQIDYMVIVDSNYTEAMDSCLSDTTSCPAHSEGFIQ